MSPLDERLLAALQLHQGGRLAEAEPIYRGILAQQPRHPHALHLLGVVCHQTGRQAEAIDLINQALAAHGPHPEYHCNLAAAYQVNGQLSQAETHCRAALRLKPDYAEAHNNLGISLREQRKHEDAEAEFREAIRLNPQYADALCSLGALLHHRDQIPEAAQILTQAVQLAPHHAIARNGLGGVLLALGHTEQAVVHLAEAVKLDPKFIRAYINLGVGLERLQFHTEAALAYREAIRLGPQDYEAHNKLGSMLLNQGKTKEALAEFNTTLKLDPDNAMAIMNLSKMVANGFLDFSDAEIANIKALAARPRLSPDGRGLLNFALAQVLDKKKAYDDAFEHLHAANEAKKESFQKNGITYDHAAHVQRIDALIAAYSPAYFERVRSFGIDTELPVFIVGMPRSGTSLTEQILASHPRVHGAGELQEMEALAATLSERIGVPAIPYPASLEHLQAPLVRSLAEIHAGRLQKRDPAALRVTDKAPLNFFHVGLIATLYPKARIIHCRRNPIDTCLSCYFQNFADAFAFTLDLTALGQYHREYQRLMAHYAKVLPGRIFELDYEDMTADQGGMSRKLVEYCGLEWDERCLDFHKTERTVKTFSALQVRQPMYRGSVERWKRYEKHLGPLLAALGTP